MSLQEILPNLYAGLTSDRVTERKKCTDSLKEYLAGTGMPSLLTENHQRKTGLSWKNVFVKVHELIIKEVEKFDSGKGASTHDTVRVQCSSLLISVIAGANKAKCYISCDKILECCLEAFKSNRIMRHFGETYTSILTKHVLQVSYYLNTFSPYEWADLLEASIELHNRPSVESSTVVKLVCCVLEEGTSRCQLALAIRDSLQLLAVMFLLQDVHRHHHMQENLLRIAISVINNVAPESRLAVCIFTETILPSVVKFYEQSTDIVSKKKIHLFTFLRLCIIIHHPGPGLSLAGSWTAWMQGLHNTQQIVKAEANLLGSSIKRLNSQQISDICPQYIMLAVELYHQVFSGSLQERGADADEPSNPPKRIRFDYSDITTYSTLLQSISITNYYPWISILASYLTKHATTLSSQDKKETVDLLSNLLNNETHSNMPKSWVLLDAIASVSLALSKEDTPIEYSTQLISIWNTCVRKSTESALFEKCHNILQSIVKTPSLDVPLDSLLKMYCEKSIPGQHNYQALCTLHTVLSYHNYRITDKSVRLSVAQWVLNTCLMSAQCQDIIPLVLFQTSINENIPQRTTNTNIHDSVLDNLHENIQYIILKSDFENGLLHNKKIQQKSSLSTEKCVTISNNIIEYILSYLYSNLLVENLSEISLSLKGVSTILKIQSLSEKYRAIEDSSTVLLTTLNEEIPRLFSRLPPSIKTVPQMTKEMRELLKQLKSLYHRDDYTTYIFSIITEATTKEMIESFCSILSDCDETDHDDSMELMDVDLERHDSDSKGDYKKSVLTILINFCMCDTSYRDQILSFILGSDMYDFTSKVDFEMAVHVLTFIVDKFDAESIPIGSFLQVLQEMCKTLYRDNTSSFIILSVLYKILDIVCKYGTTAHRENSAIMLNSFLSRCNSKFYTPKTMGQALKCVSWIQNSSGIPEWGRRWDNSLLQCLSNTIHTIRLYGCICLGYDMRDAPISKFNNLVSALPDVFLIDERDLPENVISDESANRTSTVLHCLASVAVCSPVCDKLALAELIKISHKKKLNPILVGRVFNCIAKHHDAGSVQSLLVDNLEFLVNSWLSDGLSLDDFPNYLLLCQSKEEFFVRHKNILIPYDMMWSGSGEKSDVLQIVVQNSSESIENVYKECLPRALALIVPLLVYDGGMNPRWTPSKKFLLSAKNLYSVLCRVLKESHVIGAVTESSVEILEALLHYVCDEEDIRNDMKWSGALPHIQGTLLNSVGFSSTLSWFNEKCQLEIIFHLCCDNPSAIQQLLLHLWENIDKQNTLERKIVSLHQYWKFCYLLPLLTKLNTFICQFTIQTLLHIIEKYNNVNEMQFLSVASCRMLYSLVRNFLPDLSAVISRMLSSIVYTVSRAISVNGDIKEPAIGLLVFLIIDMNEVLPGVQYLDPLPDEECFSKLNNVLKALCSKKNDTLKKRIESFIQGGATGRYEGLKLLYSKLTSSQRELTGMFNQLKESRGFSEVCKDSILHRLACTLIEIAGNKQDMQCCVEAARCLGVLGVSDYQTFTVQPPPDPSTVLEMSPDHLVALHALRHLPAMYHSTRPAECKATAVAITSLLKYKEGVIALDMLSKEKDSSHLKEILLPFTSPHKTWPVVKIKLDNSRFEELLSSEYIWGEDTSKDHSKWIVDLTVAVLKSFSPQQCFLSDFVDICLLSQSFSEKIIPSLVGLVFSHGTERQIKNFIQKIQALFDCYYKTTFHHNAETTANSQSQPIVKGVLPKQSVECLLEVIKFAFVQKKHYPNFVKSASSTVRLFNLDLLPCSWAACSVGHHLAAIYFAELWCMIELDQNLPSSPDEIAELPRGNQMLSIMRKSYEAMCDDAALTGCGSAHLLDPAQRRQYYLRTGSYTEALLMHDCAVPGVSTSSHPAVSTQNLAAEMSFAESLQTAGLYQLSGKYLESIQPSPALDAMKYECCWKLGDWSLQIDSANLKSEATSQNAMNSLMNVHSDHLWPAHHYVALRNAITKNVETLGKMVENDLTEARQYVAVNCMQNSLESSQSVYELCTKLQTIHEIECFVQVRQKYSQSEDILDLHSFLSSWSVEMLPPFPTLSLLENVLAQRSVILESLCSSKCHNLDSELITPIVELLLQYADLALTEGCHQLGVRWISAARRIASTMHSRLSAEALASSRVAGLVALAEGGAAWRGGHHLVAQHLLKTYLADQDNHNNAQLYAGALRLYGSWMVESRSESALDILEKYLTKSLQVLGPRGDPKERIKTCITIAKFCDGEYKQVDTYMKSAAFVNKIKCMEQCKVKAYSLKENHDNKIVLTKDERKALYLNDAQSKVDQIEISNTRAERNYYLQLAIKYYLTTLTEGDTADLCIFRVISLWLDNPTLELGGSRQSSSSTTSLADYLKNIPSRKLLPVVSQLAPRLNSVDPQPHHKIIFDLIERCLVEHPHHVLPVLLALKNSNKDVEYSGDPATLTQTKAANEAYVLAAKKMMDGVMKKGSTNIISIIKETELLSLALISLANLKVRNPKSMEQLIPKTEPLKKIKNLKNALIPTVTIPVRADCNYQDIASVVSFSDRFQLVGGINLPKKMSCVGCDGVERPMLLKGEDDIRQDAVMQQVFVIVNQLLAGHQHRDTRRLLIRTYKVVALSRRSGIIEWCDGTEPLGRLLVGASGSSGLHSTIRPGDMSSKDARKLMDEKRTSTNDEKLKVFKKILSKLKPVFHHFFFQNFLIPAVWYERKLAYTQSVATSSMIGYILGLGDRHVQNILVDKSTAEVIHIDLGIAFEQGRVQPTPETVPFRLTQDMVAGLGAAGVEGVFTRCCEKTMDVLRSNKDTLLTILEVLLCDPLYMWTISPREAYSKQDLTAPTTSAYTETTGGSGSEAERALLRVNNKLEGTEFGSTLATSGQVARLIQQATDINNLSRLFPGWQPYL